MSRDQDGAPDRKILSAPVAAGRPPPGSPARARRPRATVDDLDEGEDHASRSDSWDWTEIIAAIAIVGSGALVLMVSDEKFVTVAAGLGVLGAWLAHSWPHTRTRVTIGAVVVLLAVCVRYGRFPFLSAPRDARSGHPVDSRARDTARELKRGEAILDQRLGQPGRP
jgi:hypothetical protein